MLLQKLKDLLKDFVCQYVSSNIFYIPIIFIYVYISIILYIFYKETRVT